MPLTNSERSKRYRERHPERHLKAVRESHAKRRADPEKRARDQKKERIRSAKRRVENPKLVQQRIHESNRRRIYGLEPCDFASMLENQAGLCANCCDAMTPGYDTNIDHDHATGKVRGLLCRPCNSGIGHLHDNPLLLQGALAYLEAAA